MTQTVNPKKRDLPLWLGITLITLGVLGAGWFIWSQVSGFWSGPRGVFNIPGAEPNQFRQPQAQVGQRQVRQQPPLSIREISKTDWRVRSMPFSLDVKQASDGKLTISMFASSMRVLPADAQWVLISRSRLNATAAQTIGLNADQVKRFKALPTSMSHAITLTDAQLETLRTVFQKYLDTQAPQRDQVDREVAARVAEAGQAALPTLTQKIQTQYDDCKKSVTPDQWTQLKALATAAPSTQP